MTNSPTPIAAVTSFEKVEFFKDLGNSLSIEQQEHLDKKTTQSPFLVRIKFIFLNNLSSRVVYLFFHQMVTMSTWL